MVGGQGPDRYDMFWDDPWNGTAASQRCYDRYGFYPDRYHVSLEYGTPDDWTSASAAVSNIVWSQGEYDPWKGGGVTRNLSDTLTSIVIPEAAHHLDLFFSNVDDTDSVIRARAFEVSSMKRWIDEKKKKKKEFFIDKKLLRKQEPTATTENKLQQQRQQQQQQK